VPRDLSEMKKKFRVDESRMLLDVLQLYAEHNFEGLATGDESWCRYGTHTDSMFASPAEDLVPKTRQNISARKPTATIFFTSAGLLVLNFPAKGTRFNQDWFIDAIFPE
jgi:hypothetical protein